MEDAPLKKLRLRKNLSQDELAQLAGVSIKTIQRIENGSSNGSAYTIKELARALKIDPADIKSLSSTDTLLVVELKEGWQIAKSMNLSALIVVLIPFAHLVVPYLIFRRNMPNPIVDRVGRRILSVQVLWTVFAIGLMVALPILAFLFFRSVRSGGVPVFVPSYFIAVFINVFIILKVALVLKAEGESYSKLPNLL